MKDAALLLNELFTNESPVHAIFEDLANHIRKQGWDAKVNALVSELFLHTAKEIETPTVFEPHHQQEREPVDFDTFGRRFVTYFLKENASHIKGLEHIKELEQRRASGANILLLSNHQSEIDPQILKLLLTREGHSKLANDLIYVAGDRVVTDPMAVPFARGCNLICVYSQKYIELKPEKAAEYRSHNRRVMHRLLELLNEGGKAIWLAPSGGRDRPDSSGHYLPAAPIPEVLELYMHMSARASKPTHLYPVALKTALMLPPPSGIKSALGETRHWSHAACHVAVGAEYIPTQPLNEDKQLAREERAGAFFATLLKLYRAIDIEQ